VDAREDALYGQARGDELPAELIGRRSRLERLRRCREELEAQQTKAKAAYQENCGGVPGVRLSMAASSAAASRSH